jgi:hypothetical protein
MSHEVGMRRTLIAVLAFNALSQIGGAIGLLTGAHPPLSMLNPTPFADYTVPALILGIFTGGCSLLALLLVWRGGRLSGDFAGIASGGITAGWIVGEVLLIGFAGSWVWLQILYFATGLVVAGLAAGLRLADWERTHPRLLPHHHSPA